MIYYFLAALGGFIVGIVLMIRRPNGILVFTKDGWKLVLNEPMEELEKRKRIIFNVSKDKEVVTDENRA